MILKLQNKIENSYKEMSYKVNAKKTNIDNSKEIVIKKKESKNDNSK